MTRFGLGSSIMQPNELLLHQPAQMHVLFPHYRRPPKSFYISHASASDSHSMDVKIKIQSNNNKTFYNIVALLPPKRCIRHSELLDAKQVHTKSCNLPVISRMRITVLTNSRVGLRHTFPSMLHTAAHNRCVTCIH
jgi:hypothetical protein